MLNKEILLSIIVPHFNSWESLNKLINSVIIDEDIIPYEIIVIDDYSTSKPTKKFENHVKFFQNNGSKNAGTCRNIGIEKANGKWLLFADADDFFLGNLQEALGKVLSSDYDIIYFSPTSYDFSKETISNRHVFYANLCYSYYKMELFSETRLRYLFLVPWSKLIKKELVVSNNLTFEEVEVSNDIMFSVKTGYYAKKIFQSNDIIYCVTKSAASLTSKINEKRTLIRLDEFIKYYSFLKGNISSKDLSSLQLSANQYIKMAFQTENKFNCIFLVLKKILVNNLPLSKKKVI